MEEVRGRPRPLQPPRCDWVLTGLGMDPTRWNPTLDRWVGHGAHPLE